MMRQVNPRVFWLILVAGIAVMFAATYFCRLYLDQPWPSFTVGMAAGLCLGGVAFFAAVEPEEDWEITFRRGCKPIIRRIRRKP